MKVQFCFTATGSRWPRVIQPASAREAEALGFGFFRCERSSRAGAQYQRPLPLVLPVRLLSLANRLDNDLRHIRRARLLGHVAGVDFGHLGADFPGKCSLQIRLDHAVFTSDDVR